jgi:predicted nuclease with TOPRIM domain
MKNRVESHSRRIKQVEVRVSGLEDKVHIKEKKEVCLEKRLKSCERHMQELSDSFKDQTCEPWASKKEKKCKPKVYITYSTK